MVDKLGIETQFLTEKEYVAGLGTQCPACRGSNVTGHDNDYEAGGISQLVTCDDCDAQWNDIYTLTGYANLELDT